LPKIEGLPLAVTTAMDNYDVVGATRPLMAFAKEFSTWYLRLSRERLRNNSASQSVLAYALSRYTVLMAPFAPFMAERIYQNINPGKDSVHLENWPAFNQTFLNPELETAMATVQSLVEQGHSARKAASIRLRQPLASVTIPTELSTELQLVLAEELNVKTVLVGTDFALNTTLTTELVVEGVARDLMRDIQGGRKKLGLTPTDKVVVELPTWPSEWEEEIKKKVGATELKIGTVLSVTKI